MEFVVKLTKKKNPSVYKTIYLKVDLVNEIDNITRENDISFNNVVVSMIETCLEMK